MQSATILKIMLLVAMAADQAYASSHSALLQRAKLAQKLGRYEDMADAMTKVVAELDGFLAAEERELLSSAYEQEAAAKRYSIKTLLELEVEGGEPEYIQGIITYRSAIETQLATMCKDILDMIAKLRGKSDCPEAQVLYHNMKGNFLRYLAELGEAGSAERESLLTRANEAYGTADSAAQQLDRASIRLGDGLGRSITRHRGFEDAREEARKLAKTAYIKALFQLVALELVTKDKGISKESMAIMQQLKDKFTLWAAEAE